MKPKQLKCPFHWESRKPHLEDRVLYVPRHYFDHEQFQLPQFTDPHLFGRSAPLYVEYCSGNGDWIVQKALEFPDCDWIAVEKRFDRVQKIWSKLKNHRLSNLLVVCGEALPFTQHYLEGHCLEGCFINFPDPWPKGKHAKHRLFQPPFVQELGRVIHEEGKLTIATDDEQWVTQICETLLHKGKFRPSFPFPHFIIDWPDYGTSYFEQLWRQKGKTIHYMQFINRK
jgi:tRNA (guanine-N7-)-methyltransferase